MTHTSYAYDQAWGDRYIFTSVGKKYIRKVVQFETTAHANIVNMGFGDLLEDSSISDTINSNNGDIVRVLATVIEILRDYTKRHPEKKIFFRGSTPERTRLYTRILKTYYNEFSKDFHITSVIEIGKDLKRFPFDPNLNTEYFAFIIKRI